MFEEYQFAGVYIAIQAVLTLYAQGNSLTMSYSAHASRYGTLILCPVLEGVTMRGRAQGREADAVLTCHEASSFARPHIGQL